MVNSWLKNIQFSLFPGICVACASPSQCYRDICPACEAELFGPQPGCFHCGLFGQGNTDFCGHCLSERFQFERCVALAPYQPPIDRLVSAFKYQRRYPIGRALSELLAERLRQAYSGDQLPRLLVPVPMHWRRQLRRQFNQSAFIARQLAGDLGIPIDDQLLTRVQPSHSQQGLPRQQRRSNLGTAFALGQSTGQAHIAIVDDVVTTGSTVNRLAALLKKHGVQRVDVWCLCRTPKAGSR